MRSSRAFVITLAVLFCGASLGASEPGLYSPRVFQGESFSRTITWTDENGAAVNLSGYSAKLQIRKASDDTLLLELTQASGLTLGGAAGTIVWAMTTTQTAALPVGEARYDLRMTSGTSVVTYLLTGLVQVHATVTE